MAGPTYDEARWWCRELRAITASALAGSMRINREVAERLLHAAASHYGHVPIIEDTGIEVDGTGEVEPLYRYLPLPPGPTEHETRTPEWKSTPGCYELAPVRGMPIRMIDEDRKRASTPGERHKMVMRQRRYQAEKDAKMAAAEAQRRRKNTLAQSGRHADRLKLLREQGHRKAS